MLQIRLNKGSSSEAGGGAKPLAVDTVTVACPDHLILADLPVAKSLGSATAASVVKTVGRRSRRQLGERVHFCVRCDFPIAIYGRLSPCEHAFCLDCARSDSTCYLCEERIQKIQTIKMMEGIFICAAPHCLKSFLKKTDFESHVHEIHADLLRPNREKDVNESEAGNAKKPANSDSTVQAPQRPVFSPSSDSQVHDQPQSRDQPPPRSVMQQKAMPPFFGQIQNHASDQQHDNFAPGIDRAAPQNSFPPGIETPKVLLQESSQFSDKQKGIPSETTYSEFPMHQPPGFAVPINMNPVLAPPQSGYPPFASDGSEQGSLLSCPPGPASVNFSENYPQSWSMGPVGMPFEPSPAGQVNVDPRGRVAFFQGEYGRNPGVLPPVMSASPARKEMDPMQAGNFMDSRDSKGILAPQPFSLPPPPPLSHSQMSRHQRGNFYSSDMSQDGRGYGWQHEGLDSVGSGQ